MEEPIKSSKRNLCAAYSLAAGEEMSGTVKVVELWLLVEYRAPWPREARTVFSESVQKRLAALRLQMPRMRLALIRQTERKSGPLTAFWAFPGERRSQLYRTEFLDYEELSLNLAQPGCETGEKLFVVCTHGTHDLCCAQYGNKIYSTLRELTGNVWQISHVGGCRFAPNVVCLPHGIVYGRVEQSDCPAIVSTYKQNALLLSKLRGRSCYSKPVQAAEQFLRTAKQLTALEELSLAESKEAQPGQWSTSFALRDANLYRVSVAVEAGRTNTYESCSASELSPRQKFSLTSVP